MAKRELTAEELEARKAALDRGRATAAANRAAKAAAPPEEPEAPAPVRWSPAEQGEGSDLDEPATDEPAGLELSTAELARIREEAKKKVDAELADVGRVERKKLMAKTLDDEILRQRTEAGLTDYRDDMLQILIDVAPFANDIRIDRDIYQHGSWYTVDRRKYDTLNEIMARSWDSEERAGNPNRRFRRQVAGSMNPMANERRMGDGSFTLGGAPTVNGRTGAVVG